MRLTETVIHCFLYPLQCNKQGYLAMEMTQKFADTNWKALSHCVEVEDLDDSLS